jgi:hypothetical protein
LRRARFDALLPLALLARAAYRRRRAAAGEDVLNDGIRADLAGMRTSPGKRCSCTWRTWRWSAPASPSMCHQPSPLRKPPYLEAKAQANKAAGCIAAIGYHRRDAELADLQACLDIPIRR